MDTELTAMKSNFVLDYVGEVTLTVDSDKLSWKLLESTKKELKASSCLGIKLASKIETEIKLSDVYAVELIKGGLVHDSVLPDSAGCLLGSVSEMYSFTVHGYQRSKKQCSLCILTAFTFGHSDWQTCQAWVDRIATSINMDVGRPKSLLVFVHPLSGKGNGCRTWENVAPIFSRANVKTKVIVTQRAGHAFDVMASISDLELNSYDGVIAIGGDGFLNEILNGLLLTRHKAPRPQVPAEFMHSLGNDGSISVCNPEGTTPQNSDLNEDQASFLHCSGPTESFVSNVSQSTLFPLPNKQFRLGIIPAGSTDAIVICTTGTRDPVTSALHIVLGRKVCLDVAQIVRWKTTNTSKVDPVVRYAASFAGYGFYGDVIKESENYRWMGPKRYDYAGTKVFLKHRSYEAEISYLKFKTAPEESTSYSGTWPQSRSKKVICRANCNVCSDSSKPTQPSGTNFGESSWTRSKGRFLSVGAAVISCRNERAPDGLVADAHLSDGFLDLILIKDCPHAFYLWHLTQLAKKGGNPLNFKFVEHHKTRAFTFTSSGDESIWNLDGELFQAHQLSAQVFRGLISLFAPGPQV